MTTFAERRRAELRRRGRRRAAVAAAAVAPPLLLAGAAFSPVLDVDTVRVSGVTRLRADDVRAAAAVRSGDPLATLDVDSVRRRVAALRGVKTVTVTRSWPSSVVVRVVERVPVVAVPRPGSLDLYDVEAVLVAQVARQPRDLPRLAVPSGVPSREVIEAAVALLRSLPPSLRSVVRGLRADDATSLSFSLADGAEVVWGDAERTEEKIRVLQLLLRQHALRYDLRVPDRPAVTPRS